MSSKKEETITQIVSGAVVGGILGGASGAIVGGLIGPAIIETLKKIKK